MVELVVVRDKFSHESKGSAFVWYTNKADADQVGTQTRQLQQHTARWASDHLPPTRCMQRAVLSLLFASGENGFAEAIWAS